MFEIKHDLQSSHDVLSIIIFFLDTWHKLTETLERILSKGTVAG